MASRPSPFKSRCSAILNFKNGPCILSARNTRLPSGRSSRGLLYFHPRSGCTLNSRSGPQGAAECIVYAAIRETYCRPANNERFPRGRSTPSLFSPLASLPAVAHLVAVARFARNRESFFQGYVVVIGTRFVSRVSEYHLRISSRGTGTRDRQRK